MYSIFIIISLLLLSRVSHASLRGPLTSARGLSSLKSSDFCLYLQVNKHPTAVTRLIHAARVIYPTQRFFLVSDGGPDFTDVAEKYSLEYIRYNFGIKVNSSIRFSTPKEAYTFITRAHTHLRSCTQEWILWLEADVKILRLPKGIPPFHMNGFNDGNDVKLLEPLRQKCFNLTGTFPKSFKRFGWGLAGGSILKTAALLNITNSSFELVSTVMRVPQIPFPLGTDILFLALSWAKGFTVGPWREICSDCLFGDCNADTRNCATKHNHKLLYTID